MTQPELAIRLRGVVKRYGPITAVDGLDLDVTLTVEQNLLVFAHLYRIARTDRRDAIERALVMAKLVDRRDSRVDKLSAACGGAC